MPTLMYRIDSGASSLPDGRWMAKSHLMGLATYGSSRDDAKAHLIENADFFIKHHIKRHGRDSLMRWLDNHRILNFCSDEFTVDPHEHLEETEHTQSGMVLA